MENNSSLIAPVSSSPIKTFCSPRSVPPLSAAPLSTTLQPTLGPPARRLLADNQASTSQVWSSCQTIALLPSSPISFEVKAPTRNVIFLLPTPGSMMPMFPFPFLTRMSNAETACCCPMATPSTLAPPQRLPFTPQAATTARAPRSEEHTSELQSLRHLVCR